MFSDLRLEGWKAQLSNGVWYTNDDECLKNDQLSPWRTLEKNVQDNNLTIIHAEVFAGVNSVGMDSNGLTLTCGFAVHKVTTIGGPTVDRVYRWIRRDEETRWIWGIVSYEGRWLIEAPVGVEMCPDPQGVIE